MHVDDTIGGRNETFNRVMTAVRKELDFGPWDIGSFRFNGRQISQMSNGDIVFDMEQFKHELEQIEVSKADKTKLERSLNTEGAYPIPRRCWESRLACGSLLSTVTISACGTAPKQSSPTVQDLLRLNKVIRTAKVIENQNQWSEVFQLNIFA